MRRLFYIISVVCLFAFCIKAYPQEWIPIASAIKGEALSVRVLDSNQNMFRLSVTVNGIVDNVFDNELGRFHSLSLGTESYYRRIGEPSLPTLNQFIAIPPGATMSVSVIEKEWTDIKIGTLFPAQKLSDVSTDDKIVSYNKNAYDKPYTPKLISIGKESVWRGIRNASLAVCPFKYYPRDNVLSVLGTFILEVRFVYNEEAKLVEDNSFYNPFDNKVYRSLESRVKERQNGENYNYLIIYNKNSKTNNTVFREKLNEFCLWKALKGYKTKVVTIDDLVLLGSSVKDYIRQEAADYVLLIGDNDDISMADVRQQDNSGFIKSDYWYGCFGDSVQASVPIGRFPINSTSDFCNMVDKTIHYEYSYGFTNDVLLVAHNMGAPANGSYQDYCNQIKNRTYTEPVSFVTAYGASISNGGDNATNASVVGLINEGCNIVNYRGHAGVDYWGNGDYNPTWNESEECFTSSEINNMDSTTCSVFLCVACNTGNISASSESMLETFMRSTHGAAAFVGSTTDSNTGTNNFYNLQIFEQLLNCGVYRLGYINLLSHLKLISLYVGDQVNYENLVDNAFSYICGGDPSLEIWTAHPQRIEDVEISTTNSSITLNTGLSGNYSVIIVSEEGERLDSIAVNNSVCSITKPAGNCFLAINKHNYYPYIIYFNVEDDYIQNRTFTYSAYYETSPLEIGYGVSAEVPDGDVIVKKNHKLTINKGNGGVLIDYGFECEKGAALEVK